MEEMEEVEDGVVVYEAEGVRRSLGAYENFRILSTPDPGHFIVTRFLAGSS